MPRVVLVHHKLCTVSLETVHTELAKRYLVEDFLTLDLADMEADSGFEVTDAGDLWELAIRVRDLTEAGVCILCTRVSIGETDEEHDFIVADMGEGKVLIFDLKPDGAVAQEVGNRENTWILPKDDTIGFVFDTIAANAKRQLS